MGNSPLRAPRESEQQTQGQATGYRAMGNSPLRAPRESEQQTLVLRGIQVILLVRLVALVSNRASRVGPALAQV